MTTLIDRPAAPAHPNVLSRIHQISYVSDDIDAFAARLRDRFGVEDFLIRHDHSLNSPASSGAILHLALCYVDGVQLEIIQPNPEKVSIYGQAMTLSGGTGAFHHVNHGLDRIEQWNAAEALVERLKLPVELSGRFENTVRFSYPDARADFGHYLEFSYREGGGGYEMPHNVGLADGKVSLFGNCFQRGYVVRDLDAAIRRMSEAYGLTAWHELDLSRSSNMSRRIALAWTGRFMIELIEPNPEVEGIYGDAIPAQDQTAQFHHLGFAVPDKAAFDSVAAQLRARDIPIVAQGEFGDLRFLYADARPELGHYLEYICMGDTARAMFASVPQN